MGDIIIYGAGRWGSKAFKSYTRRGANVLFFLDADTQKQNDTLFDRKIYSPSKAEQYRNTQIVIAVKSDMRIRKYLEGLGCTNLVKYVPYLDYDEAIVHAYENHPTIYWSEAHEVLKFDKPYSCTSQICNQSFWDMPFFQYWSKRLMPNLVDHLQAMNQFSPKSYREPVLYHRKLWEWVYICQSLYERGFLRPGKRGLAFGVGEEAMPDMFASFGCNILATDLSPDKASEKGWIKEGQHAAGHIEVLNKYAFCDKDTFSARVKYKSVDMNHIDKDIQNFDFCWSSCALEHLGSLKRGMDFIKNSLSTLKHGGIAVHTTEFNLSSDTDTIENATTSIYRKKDILSLVHDLESEGHYVYPVDWHNGNDVLDTFIDLPPHSKKDMHLRLMIESYVCTSIGLIIRKS